MSAGSASRLSVGVVAYELEGTATGVGRYLEGLLGGLAGGAGDPDLELDLTLFMKGDAFDHRLWASRPAAGSVRITTCFDQRPAARPILWEQLRLPGLLRQRHFDLVFSPSYSLPPRLLAPALVTIHDLSFERLPAAFPLRERWRRRLLARSAARRAACVLADTESIARELTQAYGLAPDKLAVVPLAVDARFRPASGTAGAEDDAARARALGITTPYILVLGTVLDRRRLDVVIAAFDRFAADHPSTSLVIAGHNRLRDRRDLCGWIAGAAARQRIVRLDWLPEADLPSLYRQADAAVYLSSYEGFGLPPLEALACGTPCVVSAGLGLDDLWSDYPLRTTGFEVSAVAALLDEATGAVGRTVAKDGAQRMARLDWRRAADRFLEVVSAVAAEARRGKRR